MYLPGILLAFALVAPPYCYCEYEVPFYSIDGYMMQRGLKIVSEHIELQSGYQTSYKTVEDHLSFSEAAQVQLISDSQGHHAILVDTIMGHMFRYEPYKCATGQIGDLLSPEEPYFELEIEANAARTNHSRVVMKVYGVAALWMMAEHRPRSYEKLDMHLSSSVGRKPESQTGHIWTFEEGNQEISLVFIEAREFRLDPKDTSMNPKSFYSYVPVRINIADKKTERLIKVYNIFSVGFMDEEEIKSLFEVPIGFGCADMPVERNSRMTSDIYNRFWIPSLTNNYKLEMEVTITKFTEAEGGDLVRSSSTQTIEMAKSSGFKSGEGTFLIRRRSESYDIKTVVDYRTNVKYVIDLLAGETCTESSIGNDQSAVDEETTLEFMDTTFKLDAAMIDELCNNREGYNLIISSKIPSYHAKHLHFEKLLGSWRIIRTLAVDDGSLKLESVTIWVLDSGHNKVLESYRIDFVEIGWLNTDASKIFDISDECYLNNPNKVQGRDYAWIQMDYPMSSYHKSQLADIDFIKSSMRKDLLKRLGGYVRVPKVEAYYTDEGLTLRLLLLDLPAYHLMLDMLESTVIKSNSDASITDELATDVDHCSDTCRLHHCQSMSFCSDTHRCIISTKSIEKGKDLSPRQLCTTYYTNVNRGVNVNFIQSFSLHKLISSMQEDIGTAEIPEVPDELQYPVAESGLSRVEYQKLLEEYKAGLLKFTRNDQKFLPPLMYFSQKDELFVALIPDSIQVEQDPLLEFGLVKTDDYKGATLDGDLNSAFHDGLANHKYNLNAMISPTTSTVFRLFTGLSYDQCALACLDGKCSSFSHCKSTQECVLTSIVSTEYAQSNGMLLVDPECMVFERDFIANFHKIDSVLQPQRYLKKMETFGASECALACMQQSSPRCLAFDYCEPNSGLQSPGDCFFTDRDFTKDLSSLDDGEDAGSGTCSHYSRSYLADFVRIEYREIKQEELDKLKHSSVDGKSIFKCAEMCAVELDDCSGFQLCLNPNMERATQTCTMIESSPADRKRSEVVVDEDGAATSDLFKVSKSCHVFSLRGDSVEARARDLFMNVVEIEGPKERLDSSSSFGFFSLLVDFLLFAVVTVTAAGVSYGCYMGKSHGFNIRERFQMMKF